MNILTQGLGSAWSMVATFVPKLVGFLIILLIGWLIAKAISKAVDLLLTRTGFPKLIEKTGLSHMTGGFDIGNIIVKIVYYFILLIALQYAFAAFGAGNPVSGLLTEIVAYLPRVIVAVVLVVIAAAIARVVRDLITNAMSGRPVARLLGTIAYAFIIGLGAIAALNQLGIALTVTLPVLVTVLATVGGILIVGVGGGLIRPMQTRWDGWLNDMQHEFGNGNGAPAPRRGNAPQGEPTHGQATQSQSAQGQPAQTPGTWHPSDSSFGGEHRI